MDYWLTTLHRNEVLLKKHYQPTSFLYLSNSLTRSFFLDLTTALQPLGQLPFQLEYSFEYQILEKKQNEQMARYLLQKHVFNAEHALQEGQQLLQQEEHVSKLQEKAKKSSSMAVITSSNSTGDLPTYTKPGTWPTLGFRSASLEMLNKVTEKTAAVLSSPAVKQFPVKATSLAGKAVRQASAYVKSASLPRTYKSLQNIDTFAKGLTDDNGVPIRRSSSDNAHLGLDVCTQIIKDGEFINSSFKESSDSDSCRSIELDGNPYKAGVTDYKFDSTRLLATRGNSSLDSSSHLDIVDKHVASDNKPVEFRIPNKGARKDPQKRWSDPTMDSKHHVTSDITLSDTQKRWSNFGQSFGPAVVNFFDKLLLPKSNVNPGQTLKEIQQDRRQALSRRTKGPMRAVVPHGVEQQEGKDVHEEKKPVILEKK